VLIEKFLAQHPGKRFVVKPHDGSMGQDVHADLAPDEVLEALHSIKSVRLVVEEFISGREYRSFVVAKRYIGSISRVPPNVSGDGSRSIRHLIEAKNEERSKNPRLASNPIKDLDAVATHLRRAQLTLDAVPSRGQHVELLPTASISRGGDPEDTTQSAPDVLADVSVAACEATGLSVSGLDVIVAEEAGELVGYVLELNQRPHIGAQSFPMEGRGQGNAVAEAIVDYYFPETIRDQTRPTLAYDFGPIRAALESAQLMDMSLPVIGPDWRVLRFVETGIAAKAMAKLIETTARRAGVFVISAPAAKGGIELCLAYAPPNWRAFLSVIPSQFRARLEQRAAEGHDPAPR
jgi:D-alanine-D-alanine ligase-like ATP-grasp enzyme